MSPWIKAGLWVAGIVTGAWAFIDAVRGFWGMYKEYGPSAHSIAYHWWVVQPVRSTISISILGAVIAGAAFYFFASRPVQDVSTTEKRGDQLLNVLSFACDPSIEGCVQQVQWAPGVLANFFRIKVETRSTVPIRNLYWFSNAHSKEWRNKVGR